MSYPYHPSQPMPPAYPPPSPRPRNGFGVTALVVGIVGTCLGLIPLLGIIAAILGVLGLIFGLLGWSRANSRIATNKGMSIAGAILGAVAFALGIWGMVTVGRAVDELDQKLNDLDRDISSATVPAPPTAEPAAPPAPAGPLTQFGDGTYLVGVDVVPGSYKSSGPRPDGIGLCYWARLADDAGNKIIANDASQGPTRLTAKEGEYLQISGCDFIQA